MKLRSFEIRWVVSVGTTPFRDWKEMTTAEYPVPPVGHTIIEKGRRFRVIEVTWNFDVFAVFVYVEPL